jgi:hypothetical protein
MIENLKNTTIKLNRKVITLMVICCLFLLYKLGLFNVIAKGSMTRYKYEFFITYLNEVREVLNIPKITPLYSSIEIDEIYLQDKHREKYIFFKGYNMIEEKDVLNVNIDTTIALISFYNFETKELIRCDCSVLNKNRRKVYTTNAEIELCLKYFSLNPQRR